MKTAGRFSTLLIMSCFGAAGLAGLVSESPVAQAAVPRNARRVQEGSWADQLSGIRTQILGLQRALIDSLHSQKAARSQLRKIRELLKLQKLEKELSQKRLQELETRVGELETRRGVLRERILLQQRSIRKFLKEMDLSARASPRSLVLPEEEKFEAPRRKLMAALVQRGVKELEALRADLDDADKLEGKIQEEKQQLAFLFQDLNEQQSLLELNQQLQLDLIRRKHEERLAQLENFRRLKAAEGQVESLLAEFNSRREMEQAMETEREANKAMNHGVFTTLKGKLALPVSGKVISSFGRSYDPTSRLYVFKKGVDIACGSKEPVRAVSAGKVVYSGDLPNYGRVTIVDHGEHYYTLCAHLGELLKKEGEAVAAGDTLGITDDKGTPVYFEIRSRNIALNPLQWISN